MLRWLSVITIFAVLLVGCEGLEREGAEGGADDDATDVQFLMANPASGLPFSDAVRVDDFLILSGQIGTDSTGTLVEGGIGPETRQTLENIKALVERHGSSMNQVIKCTAMLADISEWQAMNEVYVTYFTEHFPARSAFGASGLALGALVELECWAIIPEAEEHED